jgi:hypothetical protein
MQAIVLSAALGLLGAVPDNPVLKQITEQGIPAAGGGFVKLPAPTMPDGLDAAAQGEILKRIAAPDRRVADLVRKSVVSPFVSKLSDVTTSDPKRSFRRIDVWFVAYGRLDLFGDEDFLNKLVESTDSEKKGKLPLTKGVLKAEEMKRLGLFVEDTADQKERYFFSTFGLFDRVLVSATRRVVVTRYADSSLVAAVVDPRFTESAGHPNQWRPVSRDDREELKLGPPRPYESAGLYAKVTRLAEPAGALFIEYHHAFCEPEEWFGGSHLLRSKIPMIVQDAVRKIRRRLADAEKPSEK